MGAEQFVASTSVFYDVVVEAIPFAFEFYPWFFDAIFGYCYEILCYLCEIVCYEVSLKWISTHEPHEDLRGFLPHRSLHRFFNRFFRHFFP